MPAQRRTPVIGQVLGHYRIVSKIGEGGMGVVYRAQDEILRRDVALKVLAESTLVNRSARDHLRNEARAPSVLGHPNTCTIHEVGETTADLSTVMELVKAR